MTHTSARLTTTVAVAATLIAAFAAPSTAKSAPPQHPNPGPCHISRVDRQITFCDDLAGAGVPAPMWVPQQLPHS